MKNTLCLPSFGSVLCVCVCCFFFSLCEELEEEREEDVGKEGGKNTSQCWDMSVCIWGSGCWEEDLLSGGQRAKAAWLRRDVKWSLKGTKFQDSIPWWESVGQESRWVNPREDRSLETLTWRWWGALAILKQERSVSLDFWKHCCFSRGVSLSGSTLGAGVQ